MAKCEFMETDSGNPQYESLQSFLSRLESHGRIELEIPCHKIEKAVFADQFVVHVTCNLSSYKIVSACFLGRTMQQKLKQGRPSKCSRLRCAFSNHLRNSIPDRKSHPKTRWLLCPGPTFPPMLLWFLAKLFRCRRVKA